MKQQALELTEYLKDVLGYKTVYPVKVTVSQPSGRKKVTCYGAEYVRPEYHNESWLYLLIFYDDLEAVYSKKHCYSRSGEDWYVAGYSSRESLSEQYIEFHPFGHNVQVTKWNGACDIDAYESPRVRLEMTVEKLNEEE